MPMRARRPLLLRVTITLSCALIAACDTTLYEPSAATRAYPEALAQDRVVQIQAVPRETDLELINATSVDYKDVDIWINRRYVQHLGELAAGQTVRMPIAQFRDIWGQCPSLAGSGARVSRRRWWSCKSNRMRRARWSAWSRSCPKPLATRRAHRARRSATRRAPRVQGARASPRTQQSRACSWSPAAFPCGSPQLRASSSAAIQPGSPRTPRRRSARSA